MFVLNKENDSSLRFVSLQITFRTILVLQTQGKLTIAHFWPFLSAVQPQQNGQKVVICPLQPFVYHIRLQHTQRNDDSQFIGETKANFVVYFRMALYFFISFQQPQSCKSQNNVNKRSQYHHFAKAIAVSQYCPIFQIVRF